MRQSRSEALFLEGGGICSDWPRYISDRLHRAPRLLDLHMCMTVKATAFIDLEVVAAWSGHLEMQGAGTHGVTRGPSRTSVSGAQACVVRPTSRDTHLAM